MVPYPTCNPPPHPKHLPVRTVLPMPGALVSPPPPDTAGSWDLVRACARGWGWGYQQIGAPAQCRCRFSEGLPSHRFDCCLLRDGHHQSMATLHPLWGPYPPPPTPPCAQWLLGAMASGSNGTLCESYPPPPESNALVKATDIVPADRHVLDLQQNRRWPWSGVQTKFFGRLF